jgi:hypothetical protein
MLPRNSLSVSLRTFVIPFYYDSGSGTVNGNVINYETGSAKAKSYCSYGYRYRSATLVHFKFLFGR